MAAPTGSAVPQVAARSASLCLRQRSSKSVGSTVLTVEEVLASSGATHAEAVIFVSLPSGFYSSLHRGLAGFTNLSELDLSGNQLEDVGALAALPSLSKLNLAGNRLRSWMRGPGRFASLESLDCSFNHSLEPRVLQALAELPRLRILDISGNALQALPPLDAATAFPSLARLTAGHNELTGAALAALAPLPQLHHLLLPSNRISSVPQLGPASFLKLALLDLSSNQVADVEAVGRLQALPSLERLLLVGNPVAGAGFGASGTVAAVLHRSHGGTRRSSLASLAAGGGSVRPSLADVFQFTAVEEASVVSMKAKALAQNRCSTPASGSGSSGPASAAATRPGSSLSTAGEPQPGKGEQGAQAAGDAAAPVPTPAGLQAAGGPAAPPFRASAVELLRMPAPSPMPHPGASLSFLDWELAGEDEIEEQEEQVMVADGQSGGTSYVVSGQSGLEFWSIQSAAGSGESGGNAGPGEEGLFAGVDDPTVRLALGLGLDPMRLPLFNGPGMRSGNPAAAIKALRFALAHPAAAPSTEGVLRAGNGSHLRLTKSMLAKQRQKVGASAGKDASVEGRVASIDALLLAMKRRLAAVQAALAADAEQARLQEQSGASAVSAPVEAITSARTEAAAAEGDSTEGAAGGAPEVPTSSGISSSARGAELREFREERERRVSERHLRQAALTMFGAAI